MNIEYSLTTLLPVALCIFLLGMSKGGFPVGTIALPLLILIWPGEIEPAKQVVAFMLPMLCLMDVFAVYFYRHHIQWRRIVPLIPGGLLGVFLGSLIFLDERHSSMVVSDQVLKIIIGGIGILFVFYRIIRAWLFRHLAHRQQPHCGTSLFFGGAAGIASTVAHAAGPLAQIYFLMQNLPKMQYAATIAGFFFGLNLVKLIPFILLGRLNSDSLLLGACILPTVPLGVASGYLIVRKMNGTWYIGFIHAILFITSCTLIWNAIN